MDKPHSNQATPKYLGFVYQLLIAIECCFTAKKNQTIWIECFGDIYDGERQIEVKHHLKENNLHSNAIDFWKTLKNLIEEDTEDMGQFILHTTSKIPENSIFDGWNSLTKTKKYKKIIEHIPVDTVKPFHQAIIKSPKASLQRVLERFEIKSSNLGVEGFWNNLSEHRFLTIIDPDYREDIIKWLHGYLNEAAVERPYYWHINVNSFDTDLRLYVNKFRVTKIPFPKVSDDTDTNHEEAKQFKFYQELEKIGAKKNARMEAVTDYVKTGKSEIELLTKNPALMKESLKEYQKNVIKKCAKHKDKEAYGLKNTDLYSEKAQDRSYAAYYSFLTSDILSLEHVDNTEAYFMFGKSYSAIEEDKFQWIYNKEDVE